MTELWVQRYSSPGKGDDRPCAVSVDSSGNVVVTGSSHNGTSYDFYTVKYARTTGALIWDRRYNGPASLDDIPSGLALDRGDNVIVTGSSHSPSREIGLDFYTVKYRAADGAIVWENRPGKTNSMPHGLAVDTSGNIIVAGAFQGGGMNDGFYTAKFASSNGAVLWQRSYVGSGCFDVAVAVAVDADNNVAVTGYSIGTNTHADYYTAKYAGGSGELVWEHRYNGPGNYQDYPTALVVDKIGNVIVTGYSFDHASFDDYYTAKYAAEDGTLVWEKRFSTVGRGYDRASAVAVDTTGDVVVTGDAQGDCYTAKYKATDGSLLWERLYNATPSSIDFGSAVAIDSKGDVIVTGASDSGDLVFDFYTAKYDGGTGALLWEQRYNGPANGPDLAIERSCLAIGTDGAVVITGYSDGSGIGSDFDYATMVYQEKLPPISIRLISTAVHLRFSVASGQLYVIESAPAVNGPWGIVATSTAPLGGVVEWVDTNAAARTTFYRTGTL